MSLSNKISIFTVLIVLFIAAYRCYDTVIAVRKESYEVIASFITIPLLICFILFPTHYTLSSLVAIFLPKKYLTSNGKYFLTSFRDEEDLEIGYPTLTIQVPIYDEDFEKVVRPTLRECIKLRDTYPGYCNILVNDDGIFKWLKDNPINPYSHENVKTRLNYYNKHRIAFTARPYANRPGRFKKAGNMNYVNTLVSSTVYHRCISLENRMPNYGFSIASNGLYEGDITLHDLILIIDSDSNISPEAVVKTVKKFIDPNLAYLQYYTTPLSTSTQNYFSKFISWYTENLYNVVFRICTRNGDISPLIGHNVIIRKSALDKICLDGKYWAENRVSEDFDLCVRLHNAGYYGKYVCNTEYPFGEGVSLSYDDEMDKYSKFAYGASEIMFNQVKDWCSKGVFTKSFRTFLKTDTVPMTSKIGVFGYLWTYFSISSAIPFTPFIFLTSCYVDSWELLFFNPFYAWIFLFCLFSVLSPFINSTVNKKTKNRCQLGQELLLGLFYTLFYSGISYPIFVGVVSHLLDLNISWSTTNKNLEDTNRTKVVGDIITKKKWQFCYSILLIVIVVIMWVRGCSDFQVIFPSLALSIGHLVSPFLLHPILWGKGNYEYDTSDSP